MKRLEDLFYPADGYWIIQSVADVWKGFDSFTVVNLCVTGMHLGLSVDDEVWYVMTLVQVPSVIPL